MFLYPLLTELVQLHKNNDILRAKISCLVNLTEETTLKKENLIDEIKQVYGKYRDTFDSCKLLMGDIKMLEEKSNPIEIIDADVEMSEEVEPQEDIKTLKIILK